jgi:transglutaminase-like putative cysteine protease
MIPALTNRTVSIGNGVAGVRQTIAAMRVFVDYAKTDQLIRETAISIVRFCTEKSLACEAAALCDWVRDNIRYVRDVVDVETVSTPQKTLQMGAGDCDDKSTLLAALCESIGIPTQFAVLNYGGGPYNHVITIAFVPWFLTLETTESIPAGKLLAGFERIALEGAI